MRFETEKVRYYIDDWFVKELDFMKKKVHQNWDMIGCVDGNFTGSGKSLLAQQAAYYLDQTFDFSRISWTYQDFANKIINAKPFTAFIYDEAMAGLNARRAMSKVNIEISTLLAEIRQKNLFIIIVLPCFYDLDKTVAVYLSKWLVHIKSAKLIRGHYSFYSAQRKKVLYIQGKKLMNYQVVPPNFVATFSQPEKKNEKQEWTKTQYVVDDKTYIEAKRHYLKRFDESDPEEKKKSSEVKAAVKEWLKGFLSRLESPVLQEKYPALKTKKFRMEIFNLGVGTFYDWSKEPLDTTYDRLESEVLGNNAGTASAVDKYSTIGLSKNGVGPTP